MIFEFLHRNYIQFGIRIGPRSSPWHHLGLGRWSVDAITQWRLCDETMTRGATVRWCADDVVRWRDDIRVMLSRNSVFVFLFHRHCAIAPSHYWLVCACAVCRLRQLCTLTKIKKKHCTVLFFLKNLYSLLVTIHFPKDLFFSVSI